jgi:cyclopropane fatty-acyl-phospholipid synthase-like methyltransferase
LQFDLWYWLRPPWDSGICPPELLDYISAHPPGRALDLGCGSGTNVVALAERGWTVTGVDFAPSAIRLARRRLKSAGVTATVSVGDVTRLNGVGGPFELALDVGCFHGLQTQDSYLVNLGRVLTPGANWLMYGFFKTAARPSGPGLDPAALRRIEASGFQLLSRMDGMDKRGRPSAWFTYRWLPSQS